jgi:TPR repeat protein
VIAITAEQFRKAADLGSADGANSFGCCFERGNGVDIDLVMAAH